MELAVSVCVCIHIVQQQVCDDHSDERRLDNGEGSAAHLMLVLGQVPQGVGLGWRSHIIHLDAAISTCTQ